MEKTLSRLQYGRFVKCLSYSTDYRIIILTQGAVERLPNPKESTMTVRDFVSVMSRWESFAVANSLQVVWGGRKDRVPETMLDIEVKAIHTEDGRIMLEI